MALRAVELWRGEIDLVSPFRTSFGTEAIARLALCACCRRESRGWGECVAMVEPNYSSEYLENLYSSNSSRFLVPLLHAGSSAADFISGSAPIRGNSWQRHVLKPRS
ncbi:hypothetical protein EMGBS4_16840 [Acidimicrobiaceae bacterium]|nr:hypothetical protein EMGBS4_16840 [Acidimicrobiaceae bacterium]